MGAAPGKRTGRKKSGRGRPRVEEKNIGSSHWVTSGEAIFRGERVERDEAIRKEPTEETRRGIDISANTFSAKTFSETGHRVQHARPNSAQLH